MELKILTFFAIVTINQMANSEHISVIAPPILKRGKFYNAAITTSSITKSMEMAVIFLNETAGFKIRKGQLMTHNSLIQFPNPTTLKTSKPGKAIGRTLKFLARQDGQCVSKEVLILQEPYTGYVFIQTDRPTYMPSEEVKFRVVAFDGDTKPINMNNIKVVVENDDGKEIITFEEFKEKNDQEYKTYGLYENIFKIDENERDGRWRISVKIDDNDRLYTDKYFEISRKEAPLYEIKIDVPEMIFMKDKVFTVGISSVFKFGSFVKGRAKIVFSDQNGEKLHEDRFNVDTKVKKTYSLSDDLQVNYISGENYVLNIFVDYTDNSLGTPSNATKQMIIRKDLTYEIFLAKPHMLRPGYKYQVITSVKDPFGRTISNSGRNYVKLKATYYKKDGKRMDADINASTPIKNSVAEFVLDTSKGIERIDIEVSYLSSKVRTMVTRETDFSPSLRIYVSNEPKLNEEVIVRLDCPAVTKDVTMLVVCRDGIVYHQHFAKVDQYSIQVSLVTTQAMLPEAKIVFYALRDNHVYFGSTDIKFDILSENFLEINVPNSENIFNDINKQKIDITYKTKPNSLVSLLAIDKSQTFDKNGHDIETKDVLTKLLDKQELYQFAYEKNKHQHIFYDEKNRNFVLNLEMGKKRPCKDEEKKILDDIAGVRKADQTRDGVSYYSNEPSQPEVFDFENPRHDPGKLRNNFLKTWIWATSVSKDGTEFIQEDVPDSLTTWLFTGFSMHPDFGFALAKPQELIVSKKFFIELNLPYSIRIGEVLTIDVIVFNFLSEDATTEFKVYTLDNTTTQQFDFMELSGQTNRCSFTNMSANTLTKTITATKDVGTNVEVLIQPRVNKKMTIRVGIKTTVNGKKYEDYIEKPIFVENEGVFDYNTGIALVRPKSGEPFEQKFNFSKNTETTSVEMKAIVSGNIMGNVLRMDQTDQVLPGHCGPQTMSRYLVNIFIYKYLQDSGQLQTSSNRDTVLRSLRQSYTNVMSFKRSDGGFSVFTYESTYRSLSGISSTWVTAHLSRLFGELLKVKMCPVENTMLENALNFCELKQDSSGKFLASGYETIPANPFSESEKSKTVRLTCFVLLSFLTNRGLTTKDYSSTISKAFNYVKRNVAIDNYAAAVCAYAGVMANESVGKDFLDQLKLSSYSTGEDRYWDSKKDKVSSKDAQILISSYAALAYIKNNETEYAKPIINWLMKQRSGNGFGDMFTSSVALEALGAMAAIYKEDNTNMEVKIVTEDGNQITVPVTNSNAKNVQIFDLNKNQHTASIIGTGHGFAQVTLFYGYTNVVPLISNDFSMKVDTVVQTSESKVEICVRRNSELEQSDQILLEVNLPSGFTYLAEKSNPMGQHPKLIQNVELINGGTTIYVYLEKLTTSDTCINFFASRTYTVDLLKKGSAKIYVYNDKETVNTRFFSLEIGNCA